MDQPLRPVTLSVARTPGSSEPDLWLPISSTYNFIGQDPLLDWLEVHGEAHGFVRDNASANPLYNPDLDFAHFLVRQGERFEAAIYKLLRERFPLRQIGHRPSDARAYSLVEETMTAMRAGAPLIAQAPLRDETNQTYGMADLLVRSDCLEELLADRGDWSPADSLPPGELHAPATKLGPKAHDEGWHYVALDIKFTNLELLKDGHAAKKHLAGAVQVWLYNEALGAMQGFTPCASYLLGRNWAAGSGANMARGKGAFERLARVDRDHVFIARGTNNMGDESLADMAQAALAWGRRLECDGAAWILTPPSVPELYPNMNNTEDFPWHGAKKKIAVDIHELTLLPAIAPKDRTAALSHGFTGWNTPGLSAQDLGVTTPARGRALTATLAANRLAGPDGSPPRGVAALLPTELPDSLCPGWKTEAPVEFFVDFETVSNLADDFSALPAEGGQPLIFQIGCGHLGPPDGSSRRPWLFRQWTVDRLSEAQEGRIIAAWVTHMETELRTQGITFADANLAQKVRVIHWSPAEPSCLENSRESARARISAHLPELAAWPAIPFFDLLDQVVREAPLTVYGAFGFGLKEIAKAMHSAGLIDAIWTDGPADGLGAMVGAWVCEAEAARTGVPIAEQPLMRSIGAYNQIDCQTMAQILEVMRGR